MTQQNQAVTILHLTDLHFGWEAKHAQTASSALDERTNRLRTLIECLGTLADQQPDWRPQVIAITGDIGWKGIAEDYRQAKDWLDKLLQRLNLNYSQVVVCPGNHDISRDDVEDLEVPDEARRSDELLRVPLRANYVRGFHAFSQFCASAKVRPYDFAGDTSYLVGHTELAGLTFIALNSAWYCRGDGDRGKLWVGRRHLEHLIAKASDAAKPIVALIHHPANWWHDAETNSWEGRPNVLDMLAHHSHLLLTGHTHGEIRKHDRIADAACHLTGGSAYAGSAHPNSVRLIRVHATGFDYRSVQFIPNSPEHSWEARKPSGRIPWHTEEPGPPPPPPPPLPPSLQEYIRRLIEQTRSIELMGMGRSFAVDLPIDDVYVPLRLNRSEDYSSNKRDRFTLPEDADEATDALPALSGDQNTDSLAAVFQACASQNNRGVVVLGEPGAGKTTWARQLSWLLAARKVSPESLGLPPGIQPVLLRLRNLEPGMITKDSEPVEALKAFLRKETSSKGTATGLEDPTNALWDHSGGLLWILDGLDEVVDPGLRAVVSGWIRKTLPQRTHDRFVVTSRFQGYHDDNVKLHSGFVEFHVAGLSDAQVDHFINRWFDAAHQRMLGATDKARQKALADRQSLSAVLKTAPYQAPSMREMVTNPLLLTILCVVYHEEHNLPTARAELYQHCVRVLLGLWRRELFTEAPAGRDFKPFDIEAAQSVLARIAWWLHQQEKRTTATVAELQTEAEAGLQTVAASAGLGSDGRLFLERMRQESGIMALSGDGSGKLGFLHLSFQEFLAADHAVRAEFADVLAPRAANSWWREAALLSLRKSEKFCGRFFREFLAQGLAEHDLDLALRCLNESLYFPPEPFLDVLRAADAPVPRKTAVLKLLRDRAAQVPGLAEICEEWMGRPHTRHPDLHGMALEILTVLGRQPRSITAARSAGDLMVHKDTGMTLVWVPPGTFQMGSEKGGGDERPIHPVELTKGFYLGKYPVTNEQYAKFLATRPEHVEAPKYWDDRKFNQPQQPVVGVSWEDAAAFCHWMGGRLPTEAEWEYACRAGSPYKYCFGDDEKLLGDYAWFEQNSGGQTQPVGGKLPNAWGLHDVHGNVWEWCQDPYENTYYSRSPAQDPPGPDSGSFRVLRGGSWGYEPDFVRCADRSSDTPDYRSGSIGFRLVLE